MLKPNVLAEMLRCNPVTIPVEFQKVAKGLAAKYVHLYSLSGLLRMEYPIVYNRVCNLIQHHQRNTPGFSPYCFKDFVNTETLFYSAADIETLIAAYQSAPNVAMPYVICFFSKKIGAFKYKNISYTKNLETADVDAVLMTTLTETIQAFNFSTHFSFAYLELNLFASLTELGGQMRKFPLNRNDFVQYLKLSYLIQKYNLTIDLLPCFLHEINTSYELLPQEQRTFILDRIDMHYSCNLSLKKAKAFFNLYSIEALGFLPDSTYDEENDMVIDYTSDVIDKGYADAELRLFAEQVFQKPKYKKIFHRLTEPNGAVFTNQELKEEYDSSRHELKHIKNQIRIEIL